MCHRDGQEGVRVRNDAHQGGSQSYTFADSRLPCDLLLCACCIHSLQSVL
jgi:hypothetical protein